METLEKIDNDTVCSTHGYTVEICGRDRVEYREGDRVLRIPSEAVLTPFLAKGEKPYCRVYLSYAPFWTVPDGKQLVNDEERLKISRRVHAAIEFLGTSVRIA